MVCRPSCGPCVGNGSRFRVGVLVWKRSWASLVPLGPAGRGMGMLLGSRTATRDVWSRAVFRMPLAGRRGPVGRGPGPVGVRGGLRTG